MILRKETETFNVVLYTFNLALIRMNDTPQGDGNYTDVYHLYITYLLNIRMNDTPQRDGNIGIY